MVYTLIFTYMLKPLWTCFYTITFTYILISIDGPITFVKLKHSSFRDAQYHASLEKESGIRQTWDWILTMLFTSCVEYAILFICFFTCKKKDNHNKKFICFSFRFKRDNACKVTFQSDWKHLWKHIRENDSYQDYCYYFSYLLNLAYSQQIIKSQFTKRCLKLKKVIWTIQIIQSGYEIQWNWSTGKRKSTAYFNLLAETWPNLVKMQSDRQTKKRCAFLEQLPPWVCIVHLLHLFFSTWHAFDAFLVGHFIN